MTAWTSRWRFPLYLRLWLAVVLAVFILTFFAGLILREQREREREREREASPARQVVVRTADGQVLGEGELRRGGRPGQGAEIQVPMKDGSTLLVQIAPRTRGAGEQQQQRRGPPTPWGGPLMLSIVALAVMIGSYPIVRRLTQRLERLRGGVERWAEGDLSARVKEDGSDEVAFLAQRFNHAAERIESLVKSHKSLLANASHELRSPLARIRMGLELMDGPVSQAQRAEMLRNIGELDQLIDEILLASRLDARETDIGTFEPVDLTGLAAEEAARAGAELSVDEGNPVVVNGVSKLMRRAIRNLLENARRYSDGPVEVELRTVGRQAVVAVCDRGPGVPAELRERIFEPFYRLPGASEREGGVGLGLALVRSIAARHRGAVRCDAREGGGARFVLSLPL